MRSSPRWWRSDEQLKAKTAEFQQRYAKGETLDQLLPEAFAVVREAGKRVMGMRHFDVQLIGGMTLHDGKIAEMRTGEARPLGTLPVYLNALSGKGVHVVTVNDYLARRDANWMRPLYEFLGLSVGVVTLPAAGRQARRLRRRHHLRHQQRIWLRLPARQHGLQPGRQVPARAELRRGRRSGLDPHRRGAYPADHLRPGRRQLRAVHQDQQADPASQAPGRRGRGQADRGRPLQHRREDPPGRTQRAGPPVHRGPAEPERPARRRRELYRRTT